MIVLVWCHDIEATYFYYIPGAGMLLCGNGMISVGSDNHFIGDILNPGWNLGVSAFPDYFYWPPIDYGGPPDVWFKVSFWLLLLLSTSFTLLFWHLDRRRIPIGHCQSCGYNLKCNVSGICPECGEPCKSDAGEVIIRTDNDPEGVKGQSPGQSPGNRIDPTTSEP